MTQKKLKNVIDSLLQFPYEIISKTHAKLQKYPAGTCK